MAHFERTFTIIAITKGCLHHFQTKDETVVRLTHQLHDLELSSVVLASAAAANENSLPSAGSSPNPIKLTSNGMSFDSDRSEFKEFVDVGVQVQLLCIASISTTFVT